MARLAPTAVAVHSSEVGAQASASLSNSFLRAKFDARGPRSLTDLAARREHGFVGDDLGKPADLIINGDRFANSPAQFKHANVLLTMVGGRVRYAAFESR